MSSDTEARWKHDGVRVVPADGLDAITVQAPEGVAWVDPAHPELPRA